MTNDNFNEEMNALNAPNFPGQQLGPVSIEKVRSLIKRQKRLKGFSFTAPVGSSTFNINLSGTARILLGIAIYATPDAETVRAGLQSCCINFAQITSMQFKVNNEIVIDQLNPNFISFGLNNNEYYYIPRPLSGTDQITMSFTNTGTLSETCNVVIYYI
jgi:hypothetical protein